MTVFAQGNPPVNMDQEPKHQILSSKDNSIHYDTGTYIGKIKLALTLSNAFHDKKLPNNCVEKSF